MKKTLLLAAGLMLAGSAMAQVAEGYYLKQDWNSAAELSGRYGAGVDGKIYVNDKDNKTLYCYSYDEMSGNATQTVVPNISLAVHAVTVDNAGNVILPRSFASANSMKQFLVYNPTTGVTNNIDVTLPEDYVAERMDYIGRVAGDVFSNEGGAMYLISGPLVANTTTSDKRILKITIKNGTDAVATIVNDMGEQQETSTIVVPLTDDPTSDEVIVRKRGGYDFKYLKDDTWTAYKRVGDISTTAGGDAITLNGKLYTIEPAKTASATNTYQDGWQIVNRENNEVVYVHKEETKTRASSGAATALFAQKISDTKAYIYHYHPNAYVAKYTFAVPGDVLTAIEEVEVDANAPVEYYNLQGVKVANPEKGLFIKKQGNKATKVVL